MYTNTTTTPSGSHCRYTGRRQPRITADPAGNGQRLARQQASKLRSQRRHQQRRNANTTRQAVR